MLTAPADLLPNATAPTCCVCGSAGAQIHYRGMACGSCKIFFVRAIQRSVRFLCKNNGECVITKETRNSCRACRYMKCLKANMTEQDVGRFKRSSKAGRQNYPVVPYVRTSEWKLQLNELPDSTSIGIHFVNDLINASKALDYAKTLVFIERLCDNHNSLRTSFEYSMDTSLSDVLAKPHLCCERTPIGWNEDQFIEQDNILDILKQVYCRTVTHFADFVAVCPELSLLEEKDRLSICSANYCGVVLLMMVYNSYLRGCEGILFPHGFKYSLSQRREDDEFNEFLQNLVEYLHRNVATVFHEINISAEEYSFLKIIVIFSGVNALTDSGNFIVLKARRKYSALLSEYMATTRPDLSPSEQLRRLTQLFGIIPHIMHASERDNLYCARMVLMNTGNLAGSLSYDMHIRKF
ncbi:Ligand-binding domain of nuclear hormone receptor [Trichostrongylus colubriformis]|uniref:Ligand-binding domain of nuclear hormone receptor n=1 Tax=Trichostrongylus colubriformis TaxID=6319 RepID=A0AAN8F5F0_TRICO